MRKSARDENKIQVSSGNVFADLGFDDAEAQVLALRADLMAQVEKTIAARKMTQTDAAKLLGVTQSRVSDLKRGKFEKFSLDMLVTFAAKLGKPAQIKLAAQPNAASRLITEQPDSLPARRGPLQGATVRGMTIQDINRRFRAGGTLPGGYKYLTKLAASGALDNPEWGEWEKACCDPLETRLAHLELAIDSALSSPPDQRPMTDPGRRKLRADKLQKQITELTNSLRALERDEGFTWPLARQRYVEDAVDRLAARFPPSAWKRAIPPIPQLAPGWKGGVHASIEALPIVLDVMKGAVDNWEKANGWPVRTNKGERAARTYFVKLLCCQFRLRYGKPFHGLVASLANNFFPELGNLCAKVVAKIESGS